MEGKKKNRASHETSVSYQAAFRLSRLSKPYRERLVAGLADLENFCNREQGQHLQSILRNAKVADRVLGEYVIHKHDDNSFRHFSTVKHALLCCQHLVPHLKGRIATAWENLRVFEERRVSKLRPPLPVPLWAFMVGLARGHGYATSCKKERQEWFVMAVLLEIGMLCLLRPGELLRLTHRDFSLPGDYVLGQAHAGIRIDSPKNRRHFGKEQFVILKNPNVIAWLRSMIVQGSGTSLWPSKPTRFAKLFKQLTAELGITECRFTPGSLRPGGATMHFTRGTHISVLRFLGRWTVERSLEHYIQQAMSTQIMNRLGEKTVKKLKKVGVPCLNLIINPDAKSITNLFSRDQPLTHDAVVAWAAKYAELGC